MTPPKSPQVDDGADPVRGSTVIRRAVQLADAARPERRTGERSSTFRVFLRNRTAAGGLLLLIFFFTVAALAPYLAPHPPKARYEGMWLAPPGAEAPVELFTRRSPRFWPGTDEHGRDLLSRILYGARVSLLIGIISVGISLLLGGSSGLVAGYSGGWFDTTLMRVVDVMLAFPSILLAILIVAVFPKPGLAHAMVAVGIVGICTPAWCEAPSLPRRKRTTSRRVTHWACGIGASCCATSCRTSWRR